MAQSYMPGVIFQATHHYYSSRVAQTILKKEHLSRDVFTISVHQHGALLTTSNRTTIIQTTGEAYDDMVII